MTRGRLWVGAAVLFAILFLSASPRPTLAIARWQVARTTRGGIRVLPVVDPDGGSTERQIVAGCLASTRPASSRPSWDSTGD